MSRATLLLLLTLALAVASAACDADSATPLSPLGERRGDADDRSLLLELAQPGAFFESDSNVARTVHYGFTDEAAPGWNSAGEVEVTYDSSGLSHAVTIPVPTEARGRLLGFVIFAQENKSSGSTFATSDQFIDLTAPEGVMARVPVSSGAGYPFSPECHSIRVFDATPEGNDQAFRGRITDIYYGFTDASFDDYQRDNNVPWQNILGDEVADGRLSPLYRHDGGFKGTVRLLADWVRVPRGKNLVFKLAFDKFGGSCQAHDDTRLEEHAETQTYFVIP